ncbi:glycoside hydrolase family 2 protein [Sistotremastrum suecicum HHB10207 ss-3]|uniref:Beta-mannosidase B n=1 Tax=Sistotremastrum suecicum HHB10207 ss-3 TaxID=1314776 RepID=A0A165YYE8_9AGAM|nr:glycoside hydrolase family 2 protein [Sistotremastrum suecicum HHB10207 ss-3]
MNSLIPVSENWTFTEIGGGLGTKDGEWLPTSSFPTTVHVELLKQGKIPDPFVGLNEYKVQWVGEKDWAFKTTFAIKREQLLAPNADLVFDGLDTYATIQLNGIEILKTNNQFVPYRVPVKEHVKEGLNELLITFPSSYLEGKRLEKKHGKFARWNGDASRLHLRKAQYNYGWDWGPVLMTVGPWRPISLHIYEARITDFRISTKVDKDLSAKIEITASSSSPSGTASINIKNSKGETFRNAKAQIVDGQVQFAFAATPDELELWWPVGYGKQPLYEALVQITNEQGVTIDAKSEKFGVRRVEVVQDDLIDQPGKTFLFEVNNVRIFCGGSNWIPADSFLTTVTDEVYRSWLQLLVDGNQNMVRVWAGGIFEPDIFYNICDELGIMLWQDFLFGCGQYPAYDEFLERVKPEVEANVKRLRHHPSIVIFAGNNEDYQIAESSKLDLDYSDESSDFRKTNFPARYIYETVLPDITSRLSDIYYHRGSPYSGFGKETTDQHYGDLHQWNVWHGSQEPWHNWDILAGRFVSEFGMQGYPDIRTVDYWLGGDKSERYPQSKSMNSHNKADGFERRLELYLVENFKHSFNIESYVYYTQIMQAETLACAYRLWRRNWAGKGREYTAGALVWQLNDCWPCTSWAIVDYFLRPKPAYFTIARELRPFTIGMTRKEKKTFANEETAALYTIDTELEIWGTNSTLTDKKATLDITAFDLHSDWTQNTNTAIVLKANQSTELFKGAVPGVPQRTNDGEPYRTIIVSARLLDADGEVLGRYSNWPEPFKFIDFPSVEEVGLLITPSADGESVTLSASKPIKGVVLDVVGSEVKWGDQAIDLAPGDPQTISAVGLNGRKVVARFLGDGSA